jgi:hypothetical protein
MIKIIILLLIIGVLAGLIWLVRGQRTSKRHPTPAVKSALPAAPESEGNLKAIELEKLRKNKLFWGVGIKQAGCAAARTLAGEEFPFDKVPALPLEGCTAAMCSCAYIGLKEKRQQQRRQHDRRSNLRFDPDKPDRRSRKERRRGEKWRGHDL